MQFHQVFISTRTSKGIKKKLHKLYLPAKYLPFRMLNSKFGLFTQQSYSQRIRCYHYQHRNVKCNQRTKYKKRSIINHTFIRLWHNIQYVKYTCEIWKKKKTYRRWSITLNSWIFFHYILCTIPIWMLTIKRKCSILSCS